MSNAPSPELLGNAAKKNSLVDQQLEDDGGDSFMTTYADLISVLLTFFVLLQGLSIVNEDKFSELFNRKSFFLVAKKFETMQFVSKEKVAVEKEDFKQIEETRQAQERVERLSKLIMRDFRRVGLKHIVTAKPTKDRMAVEIKINSSVLFQSGQGHMSHTALLIVDKLTNEFCKYDDIKVNIEGHTDNVPINTVAYPSNWELSAIRATSVLRRMIDNCLAPSNVTATGYGDRVPIASNDDSQGRATNRRIVIRLEY